MTATRKSKGKAGKKSTSEKKKRAREPDPNPSPEPDSPAKRRRLSPTKNQPPSSPSSLNVSPSLSSLVKKRTRSGKQTENPTPLKKRKAKQVEGGELERSSDEELLSTSLHDDDSKGNDGKKAKKARSKKSAMSAVTAFSSSRIVLTTRNELPAPPARAASKQLRLLEEVLEKGTQRSDMVYHSLF